MRTFIIIGSLFLLVLNTCDAQEWKNLRSYQKETGGQSLKDGCWLKKDRTKQSANWIEANQYNLQLEKGFDKYKSITQIRDFYFWFDSERVKQGHEIKWIGIAAIAANQLSKIDVGIIRFLLVRNQEIVKFANEGSKEVLQFAFPLLKEIYFSNEIIKGADAKNWGALYGKKEQCEILQPIYDELSPKALKKLERMAKGKGMFCFGVPKQLKYKGKIEDCQSRYEHGLNKLIPYYLSHQ
ncbi:MAG: hypothetical protein P1U41_03320 [Vicingaceae bacterium]|nr:hypothetical protein [Vicingaceae bacterium]